MDNNQISDSYIYIIAQRCHQVNKAYCAAIGDFSHKDWDETPENIKQSAVDGVKYRLNNPDVTPRQMHENWMTFKKGDGWVYGETKDLEKKTHPSLVDYDDLPLLEKIKDTLFSAIVKSHL